MKADPGAVGPVRLTEASYAYNLRTVARLVQQEIDGRLHGMWNPLFCSSDARPANFLAEMRAQLDHIERAGGYRMPQPGEGWRHYKDSYPSLYEIVGIATHTETGEPVVIYKEYGWSLAQPAPLYARPLYVFLAIVETQTGYRPRFTFERETRPTANPGR